ncbi:MAG: 30S ribosomal protein S20 [Acidobacteria bacterium]|nr:30S ribosomal protein S20 [Acidobacteriota bacterium]MCZ6489625.1 30S ribosomal protein S20 [Acidobacteriota bacterium]
MANHYSALKRVSQTRKRTAVNRRNKGMLRSNLRNLRRTLAAKDPEKAQQQISQTLSRIDKAVQKGILHKNTAGRLKSRLTVRVNALAAAKQ